ncbi:MAG: DUF4382 domain-containing protein [Bacteroidota bacterium]
MKKIISLIVMIVFATFAFVSCEDDSDANKGTLTLSITDAPIDMSTVNAVYLTINEIQYHKSGGNWMTFEGFEGPQKFNILELTRGESALLGSFEMDAGTYTQIRFILEAPEFGSPNPTNPGCYIEFTDGTEEPLFVPSGHQTGWKAVGAFKVPSNGEVAVTADFDARKSVMEQGVNDFYILKPTIRLIVDNQAGQIAGGITNIPEGVDVIVYAYQDGLYTEAEAEEPVSDTIARFPNAVTSDIACEEDKYHLAYMAPMTYDLVVTTAIEGEFQEVLGIVEDVVVESRKTTNQPIDLSSL